MQQETQHPKTTKSKTLCYIFTTANILLVILSVILMGYGFRVFGVMLDSMISAYDRNLLTSSIMENLNGPEAWEDNNWCDNLIQKDESTYIYLHFREQKETDLFLNKSAAGLLAKGKKIPNDMVLLFEGKQGWNQIGGVEDLKFKDDQRAVIVTLANRENRTVLKNHKDSVRWDLEQPKSEYKLNPLPTKIAIISSIAVFIFVLLIFRKNIKASLGGLVLGLFAGSLGGWVLGNWAKEFLYFSLFVQDISFMSSIAICASLAMICALIITKIKNTESLSYSKYTISIFTGIILGMLSGAAVHLTYIYSLNEIAFDSMVAGIGYGGFAGFLITMLMYHAVQIIKPKGI